ncbi:MAG: N-acetylmuramoyl-L-alanine amidase [Nitrospirae bacterium]|nr:N-acetylmuramoyl-L-alanine amidase [Nitrospirota bacterium]
MTFFRRLAFPGLVALLLSGTTVLPPPLPAASLTASRGENPTNTRATPKKTKKPQKKIIPVSVAPVAPPILVKDLRFKSRPDYTRVVFDLQKSTTFTQSRQDNPDRVIIELQNSRLSETALNKIKSEAFPDDITIQQPHPRSVIVSLNLDAISDYKLLPLSSPDRLVLDVYSRAVEEAPKADAQPAPAPSSSSTQTIRSAQRPARDIKLIVVDPGHGGKDPGATGHSGTAEKDVTLQVGLKLRDLIAKRLGKQALMTRDRDVFIELGDRAKFANSKDADLFVSIHVNSHPQRTTKGVEVYHFGQASDRRALEVAARENDVPIKDLAAGVQFILADVLTDKKIQDSLELAWSTKQAMVTHLDRHYDVVDHGVKTAPFYVLRYTAMPSILAEIAFISNQTEERLMQTETFLTRMAEAIFDGVNAYVNPLQTVKR